MLVCLYAAAASIIPAELPSSPDASPEIIVTGERISRSVAQTSSSVVVVGEAEIETQGANRVEQILAMIPNVQLGTGSEGPSIRGQDSTGPLQALPAFLGGNRPRTTIIVDGRAMSYNEFVTGVTPTWDIDRIEIFRSPQTTTQGQNSIAGAIFVNTNEPTTTPEYRARAIAGNYEARQLSLMASGPAGLPNVAFRIAGDARFNRPSSDIVDVVEGGGPNRDWFGLLRAKLQIEPALLEGSRIGLSYVHQQSQSPQIEGVTRPFRERRDARPGYGVFRINVDSLTASGTAPIAPGLSANVVVTGGDSLARRLAPAGFGQARNRSRDWSAEAVLNWFAAGGLRAVGGLSHGSVALDQFIDLSRLSGIGRFRDEQGATGVFGEASLPLGSRVELLAGLRYQQDRQVRAGSLDGSAGSIDLDFDRRFHALLPKVSVTYAFAPAIRAGMLVQRAYNPGGTTLRFDTGQPDSFEAEYLWNYELFARGAFAGGAIRAAANLFYYDMRNAQRARAITIVTPDGRRVGFADQFNAPKARSYGMELQLGWRASRRLSTGLALGLLDTRIIDAGQEYAEFDGKRFERAPHFSATASVDFKPLDRLLLSAQIHHNSGYFSDDVNTAAFRVGGATYANLRAEWDAGPLTLFASARNAFDTFYMINLSPFDAGVAGDPRQISLGAERRF